MKRGKEQTLVRVFPVRCRTLHLCTDLIAHVEHAVDQLVSNILYETHDGLLMVNHIACKDGGTT